MIGFHTRARVGTADRWAFAPRPPDADAPPAHSSPNSMPQPSRLHAERRGNAWVLRLDTDRIVDDDATDSLRTELAALIAQVDPPHVVVDLGAVRMVSSAGLAFFQHLFRAVSARHGHAALCGLEPNLQDLFRMVGLDLIFTIFADSEAAVAAFG